MYYLCSIQEIKATSFGIPKKSANGTTTWNGAVGQVHRGEADFTYTLIAVTWVRTTAADFTLGYHHNMATLIVPVNPVGERSKAISGSAFLTIFTLHSWLGMLVSGLLAALAGIPV